MLKHIRNQIQEIFDPVVSDVEKLVRGQVESVAKNGKTAKVSIHPIGLGDCVLVCYSVLIYSFAQAILLVGGFGSSEYLFRRLKKAFPNMLVMQPPNA